MQNTIRIERARKKITQAHLANEIGVSRQTIHSIEGGEYIPSTLLALKIAKYFNKAVEEIFLLEEND